MSSNTLNCVTLIDHPPNAFSDHSFLRVGFDFGDVEYGAKSWNLPLHLSENEAYAEGMRKLWSSWQKSPLRTANPSFWWDKGKEKIKTFSISFLNRTGKSERKLVRGLEKRLKNALNHGKSGLVRHFSSELREIAIEKASRHYAFKNLQWREEGERCTKFFLNQHKRRVGETVVKRVRIPDGTVSSRTPDILKTFRESFSEIWPHW